MKKGFFGFKGILLGAMACLLTTALIVSAWIGYSETREIVVENVERYFTDYTRQQAITAENYFGQKTRSISKVAKHYKARPFPENYIEQTKLLASAMDIDSVVISLDNGNAYWNQTANTWPNHKYNGDVTTREWYQLAQRKSQVSVTEPYVASDGVIWISFVEKTYDGTISSDLTLDFLNQIVNRVSEIPGAVAVMMDSDTTILASSSPVIKNGEKASDLNGFRDTALNAVRMPSGVQSYELDGKKKLFFSHRFQVADKTWYLGVGVDEAIAFQELGELESDLTLSVAISVLSALVVLSLLFHRLYQPVLALRDVIESLAMGNGDLTNRIPVTSNDDLGRIAAGINGFIAQLQTMFLEVKTLSKALESRIDTLATQSQQSALRLTEHASETEQIAAAIEEMNSTAEAVAQSAATTAQLTQKAEELGRDASQSIRQSKNNMSSLRREVDVAVERVEEMNGKSQGIHSILTVISDIAEQTNLLALNAAIEAARAGEQGRGFAVVADEVRNLAGRTKSSTEEIEQALNELLNSSHLMVASMESTKVCCQKADSSAHALEANVSHVAELVTHINDASMQIATSAEEQSSVTQEIGRNITKINDIVNALKSSGVEIEEETLRLVEVNQQLSALMAKFKVEQ
ncbi:methyl-accepting chemotaxis protein [Vibrio navarrensis]|uniref:methyl-accepting chemotaxis protein n=1 Tax=Vibrio navarrensis TaxID=29495 RepID=UPI001302CEEA|nr:methyl-accepting chemotaxis protein [Vibrio navarrensis]EJL6400755.1 methyl-accepting chemotaxis protein [Vibrio navarrensis]EJL6568160.1 methyl-accepting chemotaxis protein [Vibrio navarrensis]